MTVSRFGRHALISCAAAALLPGCGGSQPPIGAPGAMPQTPAIATHADRGESWMLPEAKKGNLLYVSTGSGGLVQVFSYPSGKQVGTITGFGAYAPLGLCSDPKGNVFVVAAGSVSQSYVYEYAHGGTQPVATLSDPGLAEGCAVDPATENLSVTNNLSDEEYKDSGNVAVFEGAQGTPTTYASSDYQTYFFCSYDNKGNLFATGDNADIVELARGGDSLTKLSLNRSFIPGSIQWDGRVLAVVAFVVDRHSEVPVYQVSVSGSKGTVTGPLLLRSQRNRIANGQQYWIQGSTIIGSETPRSRSVVLDFWHYPKGGEPYRVMEQGAFGVTVSKTQGSNRVP